MVIGTVQDLETPSVLIDLDLMERNIAAMQQRCDELGISFRPHIKTHKIPDIARRQLDAGAIGIACQKVSEAEVFADAGFQDIQLPYNIGWQIEDTTPGATCCTRECQCDCGQPSRARGHRGGSARSRFDDQHDG